MLEDFLNFSRADNLVSGLGREAEPEHHAHD
jgi:hypothetical protein